MDEQSAPTQATQQHNRPSVWFWLSAVSVILSYFISFILLVFVVPVFVEMFADFGAELPKPTQLIIGLSDFMKSYFLLLAFPFLGISVLSVFALYELDRRKMSVAVILLGNIPPGVVILMIIAMFLPIFQLSSVVG